MVRLLLLDLVDAKVSTSCPYSDWATYHLRRHTMSLFCDTKAVHAYCFSSLIVQQSLLERCCSLFNIHGRPYIKRKTRGKSKVKVILVGSASFIAVLIKRKVNEISFLKDAISKYRTLQAKLPRSYSVVAHHKGLSFL